MSTPHRGRRLRPYQAVALWLSRVLILAALVVSYFPILSVITSSLQPGDAFYSEKIIPERLTLDNYRALFRVSKFVKGYAVWLTNSLGVGVVVGVLQVLVIATAAYAFSRMRFRGRRYGLFALWLIQTFPTMMALPAIFVILARLRLVDTYLGLVAVNMGVSAFNIWLLKNYMDTIPRELDEAAYMDGASHWQIFWHVILPLARPMLAVLFLFTFTGPFNEYVLTSAIIKDPSLHTIPVGMKLFIESQFAARWGQFSAAAVLTAIPLAIIWGFAQRWVQAGLTRGAIKA